MTDSNKFRVFLKADIGPFVRAMSRFASELTRITHGMPVAPVRRDYFDGTAREYRAARRKYARDLRAWKKQETTP